jgi:predicted Zn finger-like uncharacterized protein
MNCSCPKCNAEIEIDPSQIPEDGTHLPCPECKGRFWIDRESYARRALKKEGKIYCDKCGHELDHSIVCTTCGVMYPDYYLVQAAKPPRRQVEKPEFSLSFSLKPAKQTYAYSGYAKTGKKSAKPFIIVASLLGLVALVALGLSSYKQMKAEEDFAKYYVMALYGIRTGTDLSLKQSARLSADWKARMAAGQSMAPRVSAEDDTRLGKVKSEIETVMKYLDPPPRKFVPAKDKLAKLFGTYTKLSTTVLAPAESLPGFTDSVAKAESDLRLAEQELKGNLPALLTEELQKAKSKYKNLKDF